MSGMAPLIIELATVPSPEQCCEALAGLPYRLFLDSATPATRLGQYSFLSADPIAVVRSKGDRTEVLDGTGPPRLVPTDVITTIREWLKPFATPAIEGIPPFQGGAAGYIGYDWGRTIEHLPASRYDDLALPDATLGIYDWVLAWDHTARRAWLISTGLPELAPDARRAKAFARAGEIQRALRDRTASHRPQIAASPMGLTPRGRAEAYPVDASEWDDRLDLRSSFTREGYIDAVRRVREYIIAGDIFQANLSQRFVAPLRGTPWPLYQRLRSRNAAPFAAFLDFPDAAILSASPERFLRVNPDGAVETRPIKGTRPRGIGPEHDAHLGQALSESEKDRSENLMIVDLMRNDLSRVCRPGSVRVPELFALERYATVHHLVSTVVGHLEPGRDALELLLAAFPGGSVTGAPKVRAMEIIAELEPSERGVYCGSLGYYSITGALDTNIAIRTAVVRDHQVWFSAGGGIVADSDPTQEYRETLDKARGMIASLGSPNGAVAR